VGKNYCTLWKRRLSCNMTKRPIQVQTTQQRLWWSGWTPVATNYSKAGTNARWWGFSVMNLSIVDVFMIFIYLFIHWLYASRPAYDSIYAGVHVWAFCSILSLLKYMPYFAVAVPCSSCIWPLSPTFSLWYFLCGFFSVIPLIFFLFLHPVN
jgi:hypothetical protein